MDKPDILRLLGFGKRVAEEESVELADYFVETDQWRRIVAGDVDVVYGAKGAGKSAIYALLEQRSNELFNARDIMTLQAENPRGATAFAELKDGQVLDEASLANLWKLYLLTLIAGHLREHGGVKESAPLITELVKAGLLRPEGGLSLQALLRRLRRLFEAKRLQRIEQEVRTEPSGATAVTHAAEFADDAEPLSALPPQRVDELLGDADAALADAGVRLWILIDRLDVAFAEAPELEQKALRALFRTYLDLAAFDRMSLKIFIRSDIWRRITSAGFREASHITRTVTLEWDDRTLLNLVVRRMLHNSDFVGALGVDADRVLASADRQEEFFYSLFPDQIDNGPNKPRTLGWLLSRTVDASKMNTPRELIHLLDEARNIQMRRFEIGEDGTEGFALFSRNIFKDALPEVSRTRLYQTLLSEHAQYKPYVEALEGEKTEQTPATLARLWRVTVDEASALAKELAEVGFFEERGDRNAPRFWVPFLYRDGLSMVQGSADASGRNQ